MNWIKKLLLHLLAAVADTLHRASFEYMRRTGLLLMAAHTAVESVTGTIYAISASLPATYDASGYGATTITYTAIGKVDSFTAYGSKRNVNKFQPINGPVEKLKGPPDYGDGDITMGDVPADAGQVILAAAEASANHYSMKITYPYGEIHYLDVVVSAWELQTGKAGDPLVRKGTINICRAPVIVAAV